MNISFIIPTYKEEDNILELLNKIEINCSKNNISFKIFIIDDSPTKKIQDVIKNFDFKINYIFRGKKLGRGSAVLEGIKSALSSEFTDIIIEMDADLSHDPSELNSGITKFLFNKCDMLIASRYHKNSQIINWPLSRKILSLLSNLLARFFLKIPVSDYTNGFRYYSKESATHIIKNCGNIGDGFIVLSEILLELYCNKFSICEIDTIFRNRKRGDSNVNFKLIFNSLLGLFKLYLIKFKKY